MWDAFQYHYINTWIYFLWQWPSQVLPGSVGLFPGSTRSPFGEGEILFHEYRIQVHGNPILLSRDHNHRFRHTIHRTYYLVGLSLMYYLAKTFAESNDTTPSKYIGLSGPICSQTRLEAIDYKLPFHDGRNSCKLWICNSGGRSHYIKLWRIRRRLSFEYIIWAVIQEAALLYSDKLGQHGGIKPTH